MEKTCPSCGKLFSCDSENDCWCEQYHLGKKEMLNLTNRYNDCICPECLRRYEVKI